MLNRFRVPLILINKTHNLEHPLIVKISQELEYIKVINHDIVNEEQLIRSVFAEPNEYPFIMYVFDDMCLYKNTGYQVGLIDNDWNKQLFKRFQLKG